MTSKHAALIRSGLASNEVPPVPKRKLARARGRMKKRVP